MKMFARSLTVGTVALAMLAGPAAAQKAIVANDTGPTSVKGRTWDHFAELVEESLGDQLELQVTHGEALYNQMSLVQALQLGAVQFTSPVVGVYSGTFPKLTIFVLPYILPSPEAIRAAMDDPEVGGPLIDEMRSQGIEPLAIWLNGPRQVGTTADKPLLTPEDMRGVKIRVPPGDNYVRAFQQVGANVTTMAWGEVPAALQQGVIDAVEPTPNAWLSSHLYETADQISRTDHIWDFYIVATNKAWWDGLPDETRSALQTAIDAATEWNWENTETANREAADEIEAAGAEIHDLTPEQKQAWVDAMQPLWAEMGVPLVGDEIMERLIAIGDEHRAAQAN